MGNDAFDKPEFPVTGEGRVPGPLAAPQLHPPYTLSSDVVLSEDYFQFVTHSFNPDKDSVMAYSRADGEVEAMVLQDGKVVQVYRDAGTPSGWRTRAIAGEGQISDMVSGMAATDIKGHQALNVFYRQPDGVYRRTVAPDGTLGSEQRLAGGWNGDPAQAGALQLSTDPDQNLLVYSITPSTRDAVRALPDAKITFYLSGKGIFHDVAMTGQLTGFVCAQQLDREAVSTVAAAGIFLTGGTVPNVRLLIYVPDAGFVSVYSTLLVLSGQSSLTGSVSLFEHQPACPPDWPTKVVVRSVDYLAATDVSYLPTAVLQTNEDDLWVFTHDYRRNQWHAQKLDLPANTPAAPYRPQVCARSTDSVHSPAAARALLDVFVVVDRKLVVARQVDRGDAALDNLTPLFYPTAPLSADIALVSAHAGATAGNEMIVIGADGTGTGSYALQAWSKDPVSGSWSDQVIHLENQGESLQVSTYRVMLSVLDDWGLPVSGATLSITTATHPVTGTDGKITQVPDSPATALVNDMALLLNQTPTLVSTDQKGRVTLALVADGLSAPGLTVSHPNLPGGSATIYPSAPVNAYLAGKGALNGLKQFDGDTLTAATTSSGDPLVPADGQAGARKAAGYLIAAAGCVPAGQTIPSAFTEPPGDHPRRAAPHQHGPLRDTVQVGGISLSINALKHDVAQGLKKGAAEIKDVAIDAETRAVILTGHFAAWADAQVSIVINALEDAANVFHAVFNLIKTEVSRAIDWLRAEILSVLTATISVADDWYAKLLLAPDWADNLLQSAKNSVTDFITSQQTAADRAFSDAAAKFRGKTLASLATHAPTQVKGHAGASMPGSDSAACTPSSAFSAHAKWLFDKIEQYLDPAVDLQLTSTADFTEVHKEMAASWSHISAGVKGLWNWIEPVAANPSKIATQPLDQLFTDLQNLADGFLELLDALIVAVLDFLRELIGALKDVLTFPLTDVPLIGPLLHAAGLKDDLTIGRLFCLMAAFPLVVAWKITHGPGPLPKLPPRPAASRRRPTAVLTDPGSDGGVAFFALSAALSTGVWSIFDFDEGGFVLSEKDPPDYYSWSDVVFPLLIMLVTVPTTGSDPQPYNSWPLLRSGSTPAQVLSFIAWATGLAFSGISIGSIFFGGNIADKRFFPQVAYALNALIGFAGMIVSITANSLDKSQDVDLWLQAFTSNTGPMAQILYTQAAQVFAGELGPEVPITAAMWLGAGGSLASAVLMGADVI